MSSRALRKLREERDQYQAKLSSQGNEEGDLDENKKRIDEITDSDEDDDNDDDDDDEDESNNPRKNAFAMMMDSSSEDDDSEEEIDDDDDDNEEDNAKDSEDGDCEKEGGARQQPSQLANKNEMMNKLEANKKANQIKDSFEDEDEDLDAILAEFTNDELPPHSDNKEGLKNDDELDNDFLCSSYILSRIDIRALDFEASMRHNLMGTTASVMTATTTDRIPKNAFLFGPARDGWVRPPHFVGGGMGMTSYDQSPRSIPWPYNSEMSNMKQQQIRHTTHNSQWFVFTHSDSYQQSLSSLEQIRSTGDVNALALLVADFPFLPEALLQLAKVVYQTNQSVDALSLLRRALWIYECASLKSFKDVFTLAAVISRNTNRAIRGAYLDYSQPENSTYFQCLFLLLQVSSIAGCVRTSTSVGQYLLAMDPLRDPMSVLVILDSLALTVQDPKLDRWIVELVQNNFIPLLYREKDGTEYAGTLTDMPNWSFSYALALYRIETSNNEDTLVFKESESAKVALMNAIQRFPSIVEELLRKNDVPTTGRSTYRDWPPVLDALQQLSRRRPTISYDPIQYHATKSVCDKLSKLYVQRSFHLWGSANTTNHNGQTLVTWLYEASHEVVNTSMDIPITPFSSALLRYWEVDETEFQNRFQLLPPEANPLDPNVLGLALHVQPNRRRWLRRGNPGQNPRWEDAAAAAAGAPQDGFLMGGPPLQNIDPDLPMLQVFWQAMLPWNRVDGIPPPPR